MTRKDYQLIADVLKTAYNWSGKNSKNTQSLDVAIGGLCRAFSRDNPRFDSERFIDAIKGE